MLLPTFTITNNKNKRGGRQKWSGRGWETFFFLDLQYYYYSIIFNITWCHSTMRLCVVKMMMIMMIHRSWLITAILRPTVCDYSLGWLLSWAQTQCIKPTCCSTRRVFCGFQRGYLFRPCCRWRGCRQKAG